MFCNVSVHWPPYLLVFIINTGYLLSELLKAIELGQLRAQPCVILRDGGRGTRCLCLSILRSTTQTLHHRHALTLYYCRVWNHPDSSPRTYHDGWRCVFDEPGDALLSWAGWSVSWKHCRAAERHPKANQSQQNWTWPAGSATPGNVAKRPAELRRVSTRVSVSVRCAPRTWKHTWEKNGVKQRQRKNQRSSECGTKNNTRLCHKVTRLFLSVSFSIVVAFRPPLPEKKVSLSDCQLSWKLLRSVFSLLSLLQCVAGSEVRYSNQNSLRPNVARPSSKSNEPTTFCCISSVWTLAGNLRMLPSLENLNGHPYIVLFLLLVHMCVRVCMYYVKTKNKTKKSHQTWKKKTRVTQV